MIREPAIPLFLWIASAMLIHIGGYKGSDELVERVEERRALLNLTRMVIEEAGSGPREIEVALLDEEPLEDDEEPPEEPDEEPPEDEPDERDPEEPEPDEPEPPEDPFEPEPDPTPMPDEAPDELDEPKKVEPADEPEKTEEPNVAELELPKPDQRIAVVQHVEDKNQEDNPDAEFIGDEANHVEKQTQAKITSTDQMDPNPTPGGNHVGPSPEPGNADSTRVAQSRDEPGDPDVAPDPEPPADEPPAESEPVAAAAPAAAPPPPPPPDSTLPPQQRQAAREAVEAQSAVETMSSSEGNWDAPRGQEAREAVAQREAKKKRLPPLRSRFSEIFGYGSQATTENGVNLNLSPSAAVAAIGQEKLEQERKRDGQRRKSEHRGSWRSLGIERWRSSIENYVASVQPGNQTALNTARVPFASYLNHIHNRLHPIFAGSFLGSLDRLPKSSKMNDFSMSTHMEIVLHRDDGRIVRTGITKTSGVTAFDIGALEAVSSAAPFGRPPSSIVSPDGNVYLHWEFHRDPRYACSTYFARPYIIKAKPKSAPPKVKPPREIPPTDERHGLLDPSNGAPPAINRSGYAAPLPRSSFLGDHRASHRH